MSTQPPPPPGTPPPPPPGAPPPPPPPPGGAIPPPVFHYGPPDRIPGELAGFGIRFVSWILDSILYGLLLAPFAAVGAVLMVQAFDDCERFDDEIRCTGDQFGAGAFVGGIGVVLLGLVLVAVLYVRALGRTGQTWGCRIVGIKVVRNRTGEVPGIGRALGRSLFAGFLSSQICYLGYLWAAWDAQRQTWHDKVTDCVVVRA